MTRWLLLVASIVATVAGVPPPTPAPTVNCISNCTCKNIDNRGVLKVTKCSEPLTLLQETFNKIDRSYINVIALDNVNLYEIAEDAFKGFTAIRDLIITNSGIGSLSARAFNNILNLKFENVGFEDQPEFASETISELTLGNCKLQEIPNMDKLSNLTYLNLSGNDIEKVEPSTFSSLVKLEELDLSHNNIKELPATIFDNNYYLNTLTLDHNPLTNFFLHNPSSLEVLSINNCKLNNKLDLIASSYLELSQLFLSHNNISSLPRGIFDNMFDLEVLDLSYNQLESLDGYMFKTNYRLKKVILDNNKLATLPRFNSDRLYEMYSFSCRNCGISDLQNDTFDKMTALTVVNLSNNNISNIQNVFTNLHSLKDIDISNNNINFIGPQTFSNNEDLEQLDISGNPIDVLNPEAFMRNRNLKKLNATNTRLSNLWSGSHIITIPSLKHLLVANNYLVKITIEELKVTPNIEAIDIANNPLECDTYFSALVKYLSDHSIFSQENYILPTHEEMTRNEKHDEEHFSTWFSFATKKCPDLDIDDDDDDEDDDTTDEDDDEELDNYDEEKFDKEFDIDNNEKMIDDFSTDSYDYTENLNDIAKPSESIFNRVPYILSVTSIFVFTALVVLTLVVTATLLVLRRNGTFDMHRANLPRLKIPLWHTGMGEKKHSGSVYRPLSEDLTGPATPKFRRYEFPATPIVHNP